MNKRETIFNKSGGHCWYCGCQLQKKGWQADHFYPVVRVGDKMLYPELDVIENLVPSCAPCNNFKSSSDIEGFRFRTNEQFLNIQKTSTGLRQLIRLGLVEIEIKTILFWFEKKNIEMPSEASWKG